MWFCLKKKPLMSKMCFRRNIPLCIKMCGFITFIVAGPNHRRYLKSITPKYERYGSTKKLENFLGNVIVWDICWCERYGIARKTPWCKRFDIRGPTSRCKRCDIAEPTPRKKYYHVRTSFTLCKCGIEGLTPEKIWYYRTNSPVLRR